MKYYICTESHGKTYLGDPAQDPEVIDAVLNSVSGNELWQCVVKRWFSRHPQLKEMDFELAMNVRHINSEEVPIDSTLNPFNHYSCEPHWIDP